MKLTKPAFQPGCVYSERHQFKYKKIWWSLGAYLLLSKVLLEIYVIFSLWLLSIHIETQKAISSTQIVCFSTVLTHSLQCT